MEHKQLFFCLLAGALSVYSGFNLTHSSLNFGTLALYLLTLAVLARAVFYAQLDRFFATQPGHITVGVLGLGAAFAAFVLGFILWNAYGCAPTGQEKAVVVLGALTVLLRYHGGAPEGVWYAVLIMNALVFLADRILQEEGRQHRAAGDQLIGHPEQRPLIALAEDIGQKRHGPQKGQRHPQGDHPAKQQPKPAGQQRKGRDLAQTAADQPPFPSCRAGSSPAARCWRPSS